MRSPEIFRVLRFRVSYISRFIHFLIGRQKERIFKPLCATVKFSFLLFTFCFKSLCFRGSSSGRQIRARFLFSLSLCPTHKETHTRTSSSSFARSFASHHIKRKNGILRVRINISGSLSGFEHGDEEAGTKSIDECIDESGDSVVVDFDD